MNMNYVLKDMYMNMLINRKQISFSSEFYNTLYKANLIKICKQEE